VAGLWLVLVGLISHFPVVGFCHSFNFAAYPGAFETADAMSTDWFPQATCPKCRKDMIYVAALPHPSAPYMRKTTFVCRSCNRTWSYSLSPEMAERYAINAPAEAAS
jgi:hypothetical protein